MNLRLAWLDDLAWAVAVDVAVTFAEMRDAGWPAESAAEHAGDGFLEWLNGRLETAVSVGLAFARSIDQEAA